MKQFSYAFSILFTAAISATAAVEIPSGVYLGISQYSSQSQHLPDDYIRQIPQTIHNLLIASENIFANQTTNSCVDKTDVQYVNQFQATNNPVVNDFESGFLRIEVARCFANTTAAKVLSVMQSPEFKKKAFSTVTSIVANGANATCETASAPMLGASHYCYKDFLDQANTDYLQLFTFNDWFEYTPQFQVSVYFRESLLTAKQLATRVQLHSVTYGRGPKLTAIQRLFAKSFIAKSQTDVFNVLAADLR